MAEEATTIEVFCSYAPTPKDEKLREELEKHFSVLVRRKLIHYWHFSKISPGSNLIEEISIHLNAAQIILLLVSPDFMASDSCYSEMKRAMERYEVGEAVVIPVLLRSVRWDGAPFSKLPILPTNGKPVDTWHNRD